jgi:DNA-binding transcriptional LysR family regulator
MNAVRAAKKLGITQTGATQRIKALEHSLGVTLFTRSRSGMRLTEMPDYFREIVGIIH